MIKRNLKKNSLPGQIALEHSGLDIRRLLLAVAVLVFLQLAARADAADVFNGRQVYEMHCQTCHGENGESMMPGIPNFAFGDGLFQSDPDLLASIREGKNMMPAYRGIIEDNEMLDVIAYLRSLQR